MIHLEEMIIRLTQDDIVNRRYRDPEHRAFVPDFGVYMCVEEPRGKVGYRKLSRQMVLFCVERRKAWRFLQSRAGRRNRDYAAQRALLAKVDAGTVTREELFARGRELMQEELAALG